MIFKDEGGKELRLVPGYIVYWIDCDRFPKPIMKESASIQFTSIQNLPDTEHISAFDIAFMYYPLRQMLFPRANGF